MTLTEAAVADGAISAEDAAEIEALWRAYEARIPLDAIPLRVEILPALISFLEWTQDHWSTRCFGRMQ